ncbi:MAG: methionine biosynthesis protein MetW [Opitutaceae bacterium]|nr:methionine biosynthesis protein MetW [Opitutaceae bacterium]
MQIIVDWVQPRTRVLDLGCGRGVLLDALVQTKDIFAVGVDMDFQKISSCIRRGITAYQGDMLEFMRNFPEGHFDRVICSRTLEEVPDPAAVIREALRVGRALTVGFVNHAYWKNRFDTLFHGRKPKNAVYTTAWHESRPSNPASVADFETFCKTAGIRVSRRVLLRGDWRTRCTFMPNLFAGYALYDLSR